MREEFRQIRKERSYNGSSKLALPLLLRPRVNILRLIGVNEEPIAT